MKILYTVDILSVSFDKITMSVLIENKGKLEMQFNTVHQFLPCLLKIFAERFQFTKYFQKLVSKNGI